MSACKATRRDGQPCTAQSAGGSKKLTLKPEDAKPWRSESGAAVAVLKSPTPADLVYLLANTIDEVKTGKIDAKVANATGYLVGIMVKVLEYDALEERLAAIEEVVTGRKE